MNCPLNVWFTINFFKFRFNLKFNSSAKIIETNVYEFTCILTDTSFKFYFAICIQCNAKFSNYSWLR